MWEMGVRVAGVWKRSLRTECSQAPSAGQAHGESLVSTVGGFAPVL